MLAHFFTWSKRCVYKMDKRILAGCSLLLGLGFGIYFVYFHKGSAENILAANKLKRGDNKNKGYSDKYFYEYEGEELTPARISVIRWSHWADAMDAVVIGNLYDKCDGDDKIMIGKTIMVPDPINGGVMSRTYLNVRFHKVLSSGEMIIQVWYNGKDLYHNAWDLCTVEDGWETPHVLFCPEEPGKKKLIKDIDIPSYAPKGRYQMKIAITNQEDEVFACAFTDFTL